GRRRRWHGGIKPCPGLAQKQRLPDQWLEQGAHRRTQRPHLRQSLGISLDALLHQLPHLTTQTLQLVEHGNQVTESRGVFWGAYRRHGHDATPEACPPGQEQWDVQETLQQFLATLLGAFLDLLGQSHFPLVGEERKAAHLLEVVRNDRWLNLRGCGRQRPLHLCGGRFPNRRGHERGRIELGCVISRQQTAHRANLVRKKP